MTAQIKDWLKETLTTAVDKMSDDIIKQFREDKGLNIHIIINDDDKNSLVCTSAMIGAARRNFLAMK